MHRKHIGLVRSHLTLRVLHSEHAKGARAPASGLMLNSVAMIMSNLPMVSISSALAN